MRRRCEEEDLTADQVRKAVMRLENEKAAGVDRMVSEMVMMCGEPTLE